MAVVHARRWHPRRRASPETEPLQADESLRRPARPTRFRPRNRYPVARHPFNEKKMASVVRDAFRDDTSYEEVQKLLGDWNRGRTRPWPQWKLKQFIAKQVFWADYDEDDVQETEHDRYERSLAGISEETTRYWKVSNAVFDLELEMPAAFKLVWLCLHRHANGRERRLVKGVPQDKIALQCAVDPRVVGSAIRYLGAIGAIGIIRKGGARRHGKRLTSVYHVPPLRALDLIKLEKAIESAPAHLRLTRPDTSR